MPSTELATPENQVSPEPVEPKVSIVVFHDIALIMEKLPEKIPNPHLHFETRKCEKFEIEELIAYDLFKLWKDRSRFLWRWALREWPDDKLPVPNHGARRTLEAAVIDCYRHKRLREMIASG